MQRNLIITALAVGALAIASSNSVRGAGSNATEEAAIRKLIAAGDKGAPLPPMTDRIFWAGAYKRPVIDPEKGVPFNGPGDTIENRVPGSRKTKTEPIRIVIADSRDLAYEFSKCTLAHDLKSGEHVSFDTGILRVWQKQGGDWKVAAVFQHPYDAESVPETGK